MILLGDFMLIPNIIEKNYNGERIYDIYSKLLNNRIIFLNGEIDDDVSSLIISQLLYLDSINHEDIYSFAVSSVFSFFFISSSSFTLKCLSVLSATIFCSTFAHVAPLHVLSFSSMLTNCTRQYMAVSGLARWVFI